MPLKLSTFQRVLPVELVERRIYLIRSHKLMLDSDLADLYQVPSKILNQAVRCSQIVTSNEGHGGS